MEIKNFDISKKVLLVAEIGNNHEGSFELAKKLIYLAHQSGADAVKFQTIEPHLLIQKSNQERINTLKKFYLNPNQYKELASISNDLGIIFLSTPFSIDCLSWLKHLVPAIKISSGDITYISLLKKVAAIGKPIFLSTGINMKSKFLKLPLYFFKILGCVVIKLKSTKSEYLLMLDIFLFE